jgi:hypothetical protein
MVNKTFSFDRETSDEIDKLSKELHISKSALIRVLVWEYSKQVEKVKEEAKNA